MDVIDTYNYNNLTLFGKEIFCGAACQAKKQQEAEMQSYLNELLSEDRSSLLFPLVVGVSVVGALGFITYLVIKKQKK